HRAAAGVIDAARLEAVEDERGIAMRDVACRIALGERPSRRARDEPVETVAAVHDDDGREGAAALRAEHVSRDGAVGGVGLAVAEERDAHHVEAPLVSGRACRSLAGAGESDCGHENEERQGPRHAPAFYAAPA